MALAKKFFCVMRRTEFFFRRKLFIFIFGFAALLLSSTTVFANNLSISNVSISARDASANTATVSFDISWSNSWRNQENYDAAWVFLKFQIGSGNWTHATLKTSGTTPTGFSTGSGTGIEIVVPTDKKGAFVQRSAVGSGSLSTTSVKFVWDYSTDGVADTDSITLKVFGIEMVFIPTGSFYLGDGDGSTEATYAFHVTDNTAFQVTTSSTANVTVDSSSDDDIDTSPIAIDGDGGITGNTSFPTGYTAFYLMKHEVTEGQWVDFFNTLTSAQQTTRDITGNDATQGGKDTDSTAYRNTVAWTSGDATTTRENRAMGYLSWQDLCAYADWAALRPMTELEFEKAARGTQAVVNGEYVWGNTTITAGDTISGSEDGTETITTASANISFNITGYSGGDASTGPLRVGIFATSSSTRTASGAGYYGNTELAGNVHEVVVTVGRSEGRSFTGTQGDGALTTTTSYEGNATNSDWPGIDATPARGVTGATGSGARGSSWGTGTSRARTSDRQIAAETTLTRGSGLGGRCARTAP